MTSLVETTRRPDPRIPTDVLGAVHLALVLVALTATGCKSGDADPVGPDGDPAPSHAIETSGADGMVRFVGSGTSFVLRDLTTRDPIRGVTVIEVTGPQEIAYLVLDGDGRYLPTILQSDEVRADPWNGDVAANISVTPRDVFMLAADRLSNVAEGLVSMSDWLWEYVEENFYERHTLQFGFIQAFVSAHFSAHRIGDFAIYMFEHKVGLVLLGPVITAVDIIGDAVGILVHHYVIGRYRQMGYLDTDLFEVLVPNLFADLALRGQIMIRPLGSPSASVAATGSATVFVSLTEGGQPVTNAAVVAAGPTSRQVRTVGGIADFGSLVPGDYAFTVTLPGYHPMTVLGDVGAGRRTEVRVNLHDGKSPLAFDAAVGVVWLQPPSNNLTSLLLVMRNGPDAPGTVRVSGPAGWNGGRVAQFQIASTQRAHWIFDHFGPTAPPVTGWYTVEVTSQAHRSSITVFLDASLTFGSASDVTVQSTGSGRARVRWGRVPGANSYRIALADATRCDSFNFCATVAVRYADSAASEIWFDNVPLPPGRRFFAGVYATQTALYLSPPPIPRQFDLGYAASSIVPMQTIQVHGRNDTHSFPPGRSMTFPESSMPRLPAPGQ